MDILNVLGISQEAMEKASGGYEEGGNIFESGLYKMAVKEAYTYKTKNQASMLVVTLVDADEREIKKFINLAYVKDGKVNDNLGGVSLLKGLVFASGKELNELQLVDTQVEMKNSMVAVKAIQNIIGAVVMVAIRETLDESQEYPRGNEIEAFFKFVENGEPVDKKGNTPEKFLAKIEKVPVLVKKGKKSQAKKTDSGAKADALARL